MNCNQARFMLAAYRELKHDQMNTTELDAHLEQCAECRHVLAQQHTVSDSMRLLPVLEPAPEAHAKLMQRLAVEHVRFLQRSSNAQASSASSVPDFLKPYMREQVQASSKTPDKLSVFSTAETGPLPVIQMKRKKRVTPVGQFAVLGLAASFLMVFLVGGLVLLLEMASHGVTSPNTVAITHPSLIASVNYTAETSYPHIASAVATREHIYYSAYGDGQTQWMIEQVNGTPKNASSSALLQTSSNNPLFVLGASQQWLVWLQFDAPQGEQALHQGHTTTPSLTRTWSLNALSFAPSQNTSNPFGNPIVLQRGTFDTATVPDWVHTPIQGISFVQQDTLLVASINMKGDAQLVRYQLSGSKNTTSTSIATTNNGHILTSPTATEDGTRIFWSEEWFTNDLQPHSTIWTQVTKTQLTHQKSAWRSSVTVDKRIFRRDEVSFHPQVINNTLFLLSTSDTGASTQATPGTTSTPSVQGQTTPVSTAPVIGRFTDVYPTQIDESIHGTVLAFPLDDSSALPTTLSSDSNAAALQGGTRFLLWQSSTGYQMYDAFAKSAPIEVKDSTNNAAFLTVNDASAVWVAKEDPSTGTTTTLQTATFSMFNWPA